MEFSAEQIAEFLKGTIEGSSEATANNVAKIEEAKNGDLAFLANPKYNKYLYETNASIVLVNNDFVKEADTSATLIRVENAYESFASLLQLVQQAKGTRTGIEKMSFISESAKYGEDVYIGAFAYIGENVEIADNVKIFPHAYIGDNVKIGEGSIIHPGVKVYEDCILGQHVTVHAGSVIGADGFGFAPSSANDYKKIPQIGNTILEDFVEIGANTTVDRATMGSTVIRKGVKLDNLIQIGHNVEIGENTVIAAQSGVAGSSKVGKNCMLGGQVGVSGHITIADGTKAAAKTGFSGNARKEDEIYMGAPAFDIRSYQKAYVLFRKLPSLKEKIDQLEKDLKEVKGSL